MLFPAFRLLILGVMSWLMTASAFAQTYPNKPVKIIVSFAAGGVTDVFARQIAVGLSRRLGQQFIVDNKPGGNTIPASQFVANAEPDGYTLYFSVAQPLAMNSAFYRSLPYDPTAFTPVALVGETLIGIQVGNESPFKSLRELVANAKENPGKQNYGSPSATSQSRLASELFRSSAGVDAVHVPYAGGAPLATALAARQVDWALTDVTSNMAFIKGGRIRLLALASESRTKTLPDTPTLTEAGFPNVKLPASWFAFFAPPKTPSGIAQRLHEEIVKEMNTPEMATFLEANALLPLLGNADQLRSRVQNDTQVWTRVIKRLALTLD